MIVNIILDRISNRFTKLIVGSALTAFIISLSMVGILKLIGFSVNPGIIASVAACGTAAYGVNVMKR